MTAVTLAARRTAVALVATVVVVSVWKHHRQLSAGFHLLDHLTWWWLPAALVLQGASVASFALLQRRLLQAGDINISAVKMTKIAVAANAISASLPGGAAWSAPWSWKQLRRHGVERKVATWVVIAAGAMSSFALFVIVVAGAELAGGHGPIASLRWLARALAALPATAGLLLLVTRARRSRRSPPLGSRLAGVSARIRIVRLSPAGWAVSFMLALANWLLDLASFLACIAAVGAHIEWRTIVAVYALTQLIAVLPLTPGGLGVVEAGLTALLISYGTPAPSAIAVVVLYRALTFWALVPAGWVVWWGLGKDQVPNDVIDASGREYAFRQGMLPYMAFNGAGTNADVRNTGSNTSGVF
jgi:uncharacterized membrane protein YbhN (UPF0104 family)